MAKASSATTSTKKATKRMPSTKAIMKEIEARSAEDYENALDVALSLAEGALAFVPVPQAKAAAVALGVVQKAVIPLARKNAGTIQAAAAPLADKAVHAAKNAAEKAPESIARNASKVADTAKGAAQAIGGVATAATSGIREKVRNSTDRRAQERARKEARRVLLDGAGTRMEVERFIENWNLQASVSDEKGYLDFTGCYAVATYGHAVKREDYSDFRDIYIGKSTNMGQSIHDDITGKGNPDVYADVKYQQDVYVLLFPCKEDKLDQLERSLVVALDADASYNRESL